MTAFRMMVEHLNELSENVMYIRTTITWEISMEKSRTLRVNVRTLIFERNKILVKYSWYNFDGLSSFGCKRRWEKLNKHGMYWQISHRNSKCTGVPDKPSHTNIPIVFAFVFVLNPVRMNALNRVCDRVVLLRLFFVCHNQLDASFSHGETHKHINDRM